MMKSTRVVMYALAVVGGIVLNSSPTYADQDCVDKVKRVANFIHQANHGFVDNDIEVGFTDQRYLNTESQEFVLYSCKFKSSRTRYDVLVVNEDEECLIQSIEKVKLNRAINKAVRE